MRKRFVGAALMAALFVPLTPATAHDLVQGPTIMHQVTNGPCVLNRTGLSGDLADVRTIAKGWVGHHPTSQCYVHQVVAAGNLKLELKIQKSSTTAPTYTWDACKKSEGVHTNQQDTEVLRLALWWRTERGRNLLCGSGWYRIKGYSWRWINGAWRGGAHATWSKPHFIDLSSECCDN